MKKNNHLHGFWFGYIDSFVVIAVIFLILFVTVYAESLQRTEREKVYIKARDSFIDSLEQMGVKTEASLQIGGWRISIADNILFDISSAEISKEGNEYINQIIGIVTTFFNEKGVKNTARIIVGGHSDKTGNRSWSEEERKRYNLRLSEIRANNVASIFQKNMPDVWIEATGYGEKYPKELVARESENRRISIVVQLLAAEYFPKDSPVRRRIEYINIADSTWKN